MTGCFRSSISTILSCATLSRTTSLGACGRKRPVVDLSKLFALFQTLDPETVALFMQFATAAQNHSEGPNEFVKKSLRKVLPVETVKATRVK